MGNKIRSCYIVWAPVSPHDQQHPFSQYLSACRMRVSLLCIVYLTEFARFRLLIVSLYLRCHIEIIQGSGQWRKFDSSEYWLNLFVCFLLVIVAFIKILLLLFCIWFSILVVVVSLFVTLICIVRFSTYVSSLVSVLSLASGHVHIVKVLLINSINENRNCIPEIVNLYK